MYEETLDENEKTRLDPLSIPQFTEDLLIPDVFDPVTEWKCGHATHSYAVDISEFKQQVLPTGMPQTPVYGYGGVVKDRETGECVYKRSSPGPTFEAVRGQTIQVQYINRLVRPHMLAVDPTLHWANPNNMPMEPPKPWPLFPPGFPKAQAPIPTVTHLHGGENPAIYDGHPDAWFTSGEERGSAFVTTKMIYENTQPPATLWYHDHAMGITRLNVVAGLAGFYLLRDPADPWDSPQAPFGSPLPHGKYEIPLVLQDRIFNTDGSVYYPQEGVAPSVHPYWVPGYIGDCLLVNGKVWPRLSVERKRYRFRLLNGSNERVYNLSFSTGMTFWAIGSDSGYLERPVELTSLLIAPGERYDLVVDFSFCQPGEQIFLRNDARAPYPAGDPVEEATTARVMRFDIGTEPCLTGPRFCLPSYLQQIPPLRQDSPARLIVLNAQEYGSTVLMMTLNGLPWMAPVTETPRVGSTEDWFIINLLGGAHPIHLHLVPFQIISRQAIDADAYQKKWQELNGTPPIMNAPLAVPFEPYLTGPPMPPAPQESAWKDTVLVNVNEVLHFRIRFAPQSVSPCAARPGVNLFPFNPSAAPGYVWHCHILDHEDNEMMRPLQILP
ncbi:multicopper oxidase domain-containing protein [Aminipila butyrica]|uniref:Multicopper oxidase domain-containing protein n=2 Tax=Aminipila butyrica TaxID=433296 RepID=A0A858C241_9FIRM|nr:multicopper oxidase [Aminipila butyrica]QIB70796.1 multicopper oxidase domain-containing protein [Aminipila butyrica]